MSKPLLYSYWRSSCAWRIRAALYLKGINFDQKAVDLFAGEQKNEKVTKENPFQLIPILVVDGVPLSESLAIFEYLEEKYPEKKTLLPGSAEDRAKIRALALQIIANTQPLQNHRVLCHLTDDAHKRSEWARHWIETTFDKLEESIKASKGRYAYGDELTLVDICIPPQCYNARRFGVDMAKYPSLTKLEKVLNELPEFKKAHCYSQPDTPESEKGKPLSP